jgi:hypothetical protein
MKDTNPGAVRYENLQGVAYRILCARGHLFVLTSTGMYIMRGLVERFLNEPLGVVVTPILALPMEAVDAASAGEDWVLIVLPDCVLRLDLELLTGAAANGASSDYQEKQAVVLRPDWTRREDRMPVAG